MLLSDQAETILHDIQRWVGRETQPVEASVGGRQVIMGLRGFVDVKPRSQTTKTLNR